MIVGFAGAPRAGKDTAANALVKRHGWVKIGFSDAIVAEVANRYRATLEAYVDEHFSQGLVTRLGYGILIDRLLVTERTPWSRAFLQDHGAARRLECPDYWVDRVAERLANLPAGQNTAVCGVRYPNEVSCIRKAGGLMVKVVRPGIDPGPHPVEHGLDDYGAWDAILVNDGTVRDLEAKVEAWVRDRT